MSCACNGLGLAPTPAITMVEAIEKGTFCLPLTAVCLLSRLVLFGFDLQLQCSDDVHVIPAIRT